MDVFETLTRSIDQARTFEQALDMLLEGMAQRVKATSNDQNVQKLARDIRGAAPALAAAVAAKRPAGVP